MTTNLSEVKNVSLVDRPRVSPDQPVTGLPPANPAPPSAEPSGSTPAPTRLERIAIPIGGPRILGAGIGGIFVTCLWIGMFTVGHTVPSSYFRNGLLSLAGPGAATDPSAFPIASWTDAVFALFVVAFAYTPSNLAMLCCLASLIGCLGQIATTDPAEQTETRGALSLRPAISAVTWGFFIYLFLISGTLLAVENPFSATTPDQYLRLAGTASLLAFVVGWQPEILNKLVAQIGQSRIGGQSQSGATK